MFTVTGVQGSVAVGAAQVAVADAPAVSKLILAGQPLMAGAVTSLGHGSAPTLMVKLQVAVLLAASLAV